MNIRITANRLKKAVLVLLSAGILLGMSGCGLDISKKVDGLKESGYVAEEADKGFCISEDGVDYYFERGLTGFAFKKAELKAPSKNDDRQATVTISRQGMNRMHVLFVSPYLKRNDGDGKEPGSASFFFKFKNGFTKENLTNNRGFHDTNGDYDSMTGTYLSAEELQSIYDRGLNLEKEIN